MQISIRNTRRIQQGRKNNEKQGEDVLASIKGGFQTARSVFKQKAKVNVGTNMKFGLLDT